MRAAHVVLLAMVLACAYMASAKLSFTVLGDWGRKISYANTIGKTSESLGASMIMALGDNFYEDGVKSTKDLKWKTVFEKVYTHSFFKRKWYAIAGNHDYHGSVKAQINYHKVSKRWNFPARYYKVHKSFGSVTVDFFMLNTVPLFYSDKELRRTYKVKSFDKKQLAWLDRSLGASKATWKIVMGHHQVYSTSTRHDTSPRFIKSLKPIFAKHKVPIYVNGHLHHAEHLVSQDVHYVTSGNVANQDYATNMDLPGVKKLYLYPMKSEFSSKCKNNGCLGFSS